MRRRRVVVNVLTNQEKTSPTSEHVVSMSSWIGLLSNSTLTREIPPLATLEEAGNQASELETG